MSEIDNQIDDYILGVMDGTTCPVCGEEIGFCTCPDMSKLYEKPKRKARGRK